MSSLCDTKRKPPILHIGVFLCLIVYMECYRFLETDKREGHGSYENFSGSGYAK